LHRLRPIHYFSEFLIILSEQLTVVQDLLLVLQCCSAQRIHQI
jgi:hypothetical protein